MARLIDDTDCLRRNRSRSIGANFLAHRDIHFEPVLRAASADTEGLLSAFAHGGKSSTARKEESCKTEAAEDQMLRMGEPTVLKLHYAYLLTNIGPNDSDFVCSTQGYTFWLHFIYSGALNIVQRELADDKPLDKPLQAKSIKQGWLLHYSLKEPKNPRRIYVVVLPRQISIYMSRQASIQTPDFPEIRLSMDDCISLQRIRLPQNPHGIQLLMMSNEAVILGALTEIIREFWLQAFNCALDPHYSPPNTLSFQLCLAANTHSPFSFSSSSNSSYLLSQSPCHLSHPPITVSHIPSNNTPCAQELAPSGPLHQSCRSELTNNKGCTRKSEVGSSACTDKSAEARTSSHTAQLLADQPPIHQCHPFNEVLPNSTPQSVLIQGLIKSVEIPASSTNITSTILSTGLSLPLKLTTAPLLHKSKFLQSQTPSLSVQSPEPLVVSLPPVPSFTLSTPSSSPLSSSPPTQSFANRSMIVCSNATSVVSVSASGAPMLRQQRTHDSLVPRLAIQLSSALRTPHAQSASFVDFVTPPGYCSSESKDRHLCGLETASEDASATATHLRQRSVAHSVTESLGYNENQSMHPQPVGSSVPETFSMKTATFKDKRPSKEQRFSAPISMRTSGLLLDFVAQVSETTPFIN
ncbi:unnamed protein product [Protopolystoma xenopodis]|uniref:PH domain-containing protein n=1 Tax=Protopolystoma xenopodis TaxID=117903 RepID=A0A3S5CMK0_9PLAT|nr:unnamed protein product [Protopolystoma xenopodis]